MYAKWLRWFVDVFAFVVHGENALNAASDETGATNLAAFCVALALVALAESRVLTVVHNDRLSFHLRTLHILLFLVELCLALRF